MRDARHEVVRRGYDEIADRYLEARVTGGDLALLPELVARLSVGDAVLDAGCGAGVPVTTQLVDADLEVVGIDVSSAQVRLARSHSPGARLAQADLVALPFDDGSFAGLVSYYAVIHVPRSEHRLVFDEFRRVLVPGGVALLCLGAGDTPEDHDPESWLGAPMFWSHFDAETNLEMLRASGFDIIRHELLDDPMDHGRHLFALVSAP
ncbi:MAG TPA: class I SAM-dependent methyltransferase [Acidimicrobiia bacterium]